MRCSFFLSLIILFQSVWALELSDRQQIKERIRPVGQVRLAEQESSKSGASVTPQEPPGQAIYEKNCSVCHRDGLAGAPKFRAAADWQSRLDKNTIDELVAIATKGLNAMPMKGTCTECTDEDLKNAIQYMLPQP